MSELLDHSIRLQCEKEMKDNNQCECESGNQRYTFSPAKQILLIHNNMMRGIWFQDFITFKNAWYR